MRTATVEPTLEQRIETTKAALREVNRGDLVRYLWDAESCRQLSEERGIHPPDQWCHHPASTTDEDQLLIRKAMFMSSMDLYTSVRCDPCWLRGRPQECLNITPTEWALGRVCHLHQQSQGETS